MARGRSARAPRGQPSAARRAFIDALRKAPVVRYAAQKAGIGRSTYYAWRAASRRFAAEADAALAEGTASVNDLARSKILAAIDGGNLTASIFWLKHRDPDFTPRGTLVVETVPRERPLTPEQRESLTRSLTNAGLTGPFFGEPLRARGATPAPRPIDQDHAKRIGRDFRDAALRGLLERECEDRKKFDESEGASP